MSNTHALSIATRDLLDYHLIPEDTKLAKVFNGKYIRNNNSMYLVILLITSYSKTNITS